jgi:hypothetical protein
MVISLGPQLIKRYKPLLPAVVPQEGAAVSVSMSSGDGIDTDSVYLTRGVLPGSAVMAVGRRTKGGKLMTRQNNDSLAVPQGRRKTAETVSLKERGGKWTADDEQAYQLDLFDRTAESGLQRPDENDRPKKRIFFSQSHKAPKLPNKVGAGVPATT